MSFTDDDLKRSKERMCTRERFYALLARLEAAELAVEKANIIMPALPPLMKNTPRHLQPDQKLVAFREAVEAWRKAAGK